MCSFEKTLRGWARVNQAPCSFQQRRLSPRQAENRRD